MSLHIKYDETLSSYATKTNYVYPIEDWGIHNKIGNKKLFLASKKLIESVINNNDKMKRIQAINKFISVYKSIKNNPEFPDASDTYVREMVLCYAEKVATAIKIPVEIAMYLY